MGNRVPFLVLFLFSFGIVSAAKNPSPVLLENQNFKIVVEPKNGAISSFLVKKNNCDLVGEKRLMANFRICLPLDDYLCNYIDGMEQIPRSISQKENAVTVSFSGMKSPKGTYPIDLVFTIKLEEDYVSFRAKLTNHDGHSVSEFWFPRIGGWTDFGRTREAELAFPKYQQDSRHDVGLFKNFPGRRNYGADAAEWSMDYPGMPMPWWDIYDEKADLGLYLGYHDATFRYSTWHAYLTPDSTGNSDSWFTKEQAAGLPVGIVFSHVRYPFIHSGETFESGEFIVRIHKGDWHDGSQFYRRWFMAHFPFDKSKSWLRKESSWFASIILQPEDRMVTDFKGYDRWTREAKKYGIGCYEMDGWNVGGTDREYPLYVPDEKLGGRDGFRNLLKSVKDRGDHLLVFCNYNVLDMSTDWYKRELFRYMAQDQFGNQGIWMAWGESTLLARKNLSSRYHVRSSVVPGIEKILEDYLLERVRDGAQGFQVDKLCVGHSLDFNPLNTAKPDVALYEGLAQAIGRLYGKCLEINPDFRMSSEFAVDRLIPYFDVGYRNATGYEASALRYVFPEWTACQHVASPRDFRGVNGAALTGSVICAEPEYYQGTLDQPLYSDLARYIREVGRIRKELADIVFLGKYNDDLDAKVLEAGNGLKPSGVLHYKVHEHPLTGRRAIVIANDSSDPVRYVWEFTGKNGKQALRYAPYEKVRTVNRGEAITIEANGLNFIVEAE